MTKKHGLKSNLLRREIMWYMHEFSYSKIGVGKVYTLYKIMCNFVDSNRKMAMPVVSGCRMW